jgi:protein O-mannosyl-transferase
MTSRRTPPWLWLLALSLPLLLYASSLGNDFLVDDAVIIASNTRLPPGQGPLAILLRPEQFADFTLPYYRPLTNLSYWLETRLWGLAPTGFHASNWLLHAAVTGATLALARALTGDLAVAAVAALLFAVHPIHVESVDMVQGRTDLLATLGLLLSLLAALRAARETARGPALAFGGASLAAFAAALLSKEVAVTWPLLLAGVWWAAPAEARRHVWRFGGILLAGLALLGGYLVLRGALLGSILPADLSSLLVPRLGLAPISLMTYLGWLLWPFRFSFVHVIPAPTAWLDPRTLAGILGLAVWLSTLYPLARHHRAAALGAGWTLAALLPVANLIPIPGFVAAERYLYLPSVGFCLLVACLVARAWSLASRPALRRTLEGLGLAALIAFAVAIQLRTDQWADPLQAFERMAEAAPTSFFVQGNLGLEYLKRGRIPEAVAALRRAADLEPAQPRAWNNLGVALVRGGHLTEARAAYEQAIRLHPGYARAHENLAQLLAALGERDQAEAALRRARALRGH